MELGGNAPFIVFADADLDAAVDGAMIAKMRNAGEACTAANRFYIESSVAQEFSKQLAERMAVADGGARHRSGDRGGPAGQRRDRRQGRPAGAGATAAGASIVVGGNRPERAGFFYEPTVLVNVAPDSPILGDEIFGPVAPIVHVRVGGRGGRAGQRHPVRAGVLRPTLHRRPGPRVAGRGRLESGMVGLNRGLVSDPAAPFGGVKQSGIGREGGHEGMLDYTESKYIALQW